MWRFLCCSLKTERGSLLEADSHTTQVDTIHTYRHVRHIQTQTQCIPHTHTHGHGHGHGRGHGQTHMGRHRDISTRQPSGRHRLRWKTQEAWSTEFKSRPAFNETAPRGKCFISFLNVTLICCWWLGLNYQWARICTALQFCCHDPSSPHGWLYLFNFEPKQILP